MDERRELGRKNLIIYSRVSGRNVGNLLGNLCDLGLKGAMIIREEPQERNTVILLRFDLPDLGRDLFDVEHMDIIARVVYCQPDVYPNFNNIGFEFLEVDSQQKTFIERMMEEYEFNREIPTYPTPPSVLKDKI